MFCKFCGNRITENTKKCVSCGAKIDLNDGGQSFFDDLELTAWQGGAFDNNSVVPKTEMLNVPKEMKYIPMSSEPMPQMDDMLMNDEASTLSRRPRTYEKRSIAKRDKQYDNLMIFCVVAVLIIVLLVVTLIVCLNDRNDNKDADVVQDTYTQQVETPDYSYPVEDDREEITDIQIFVEDKQMEYPVSAYMVNDVLYLSIDRILRFYDYKDGVPADAVGNVVKYVHKTLPKEIDLEKGTQNIWIKENNEEGELRLLDDVNFNVDNETYVPARSFFGALGYSCADYNADANKMIVMK